MGKSISKPVPTDTIVIEDAFVVGLLTKKDKLIQEGRAISGQIDELQKKIDVYVEKEKAITTEVDPKELIEQGNAIRDELNTKVKELEALAEKIHEAKLAAIPQEMKDEHMALNNKREKLEKERNKVGLEVQKIKDRVIPKLQKLAQKHLNEYEDLLTANVKDGVVIIEKFSHLQEWKRQWNERNKK